MNAPLIGSWRKLDVFGKTSVLNRIHETVSLSETIAAYFLRPSSICPDHCAFITKDDVPNGNLISVFICLPPSRRFLRHRKYQDAFQCRIWSFLHSLGNNKMRCSQTKREVFIDNHNRKWKKKLYFTLIKPL